MSIAGNPRRAIDLLMELKTVIQEQENTINAQNRRIAELELEIKHLKNKNSSLQGDAAAKNKRKTKEQKIVRSSSATSTSFKKEYDGSGDLSSSVRRSSSFQKRHLEEQDASKRAVDYELSSDLIDKQIELLRNVYGGQNKAEDAARIIQQAFRKHRMKQNFRKIRQSKTRRLTIENKLSNVDMNNSDKNQEVQEKNNSENMNEENTNPEENLKKNEEDTVDNLNYTSSSMVEVVELVLEHSYAETNNDVDEVKSPDHLSKIPTVTESADKSIDEEIRSLEKSASISLPSSTEDTVNATESGEECDSGTLKRNNSAELLSNEDEPLTPTAKSEKSLEMVNFDKPISDEELVKQILASVPTEMVAEANSSHRKRKRHGYETVVPMRVKPEDIITSNDDSASEKSTESATLKSQTTGDEQTLRSNFRRSLPVSSSLRSRNSDRGSVLIPSSEHPWSRTGSDLSLTGYENDADADSIRSSDTASIASTQSELSSIADGYQRRSTLSTRGSWHVDTSNDVMRKRLYRIGLNIFNKKPSKGLEFLIEHAFVARTAPAVAQFLLNRKGLSRQMVGEYLGNTQKRFNQDVLDAVCELMDFSDMALDEALRHFQSQIKVQGEAQKVERLIEAFSQRYCVCNPKLIERLNNPDSIFILAFAIIMLNTDLHTPNIKQDKRMSPADFSKNLKGIDNGSDLDEQMLFNIYNRIRDEELKTNDDHVTQVLNVEKSILGKKPVLAVPYRRLVCYCRLYQVTDPAKPQKAGLHQREVFLFNDLLLVTKVLQRKKNNTTYTYKSSLPLQGMNVLLFETTYYFFGIRLISTMDNKVLITFNAPNEHDRNKFITDLRESILEVQQMENQRIGAELERAQLPVEPRISGFSDSKKMSTSMQNLNDVKGQRLYTNQLTSMSERPVSMYAMPSPSLEPNANENNHNNGSLEHSKQGKHIKTGINNNSTLSTPAKSESSLLGSIFGSGRRSKSPSNHATSPVNKNPPQITLTFSKV